MYDILKRYIQKYYNLEYIIIDGYIVDGANCEVKFYTDGGKYYHKQININIWDMLVFLNVC